MPKTRVACFLTHNAQGSDSHQRHVDQCTTRAVCCLQYYNVTDIHVYHSDYEHNANKKTCIVWYFGIVHTAIQKQKGLGQTYPPSETPTAMIGEPGKRFPTCSITSDRSSVFDAQYVRGV